MGFQDEPTMDARVPMRLTKDVEVSYRQQLQSDIDRLQAMLDKKLEMIKLLDENPAIEKFMNLSR